MRLIDGDMLIEAIKDGLIDFMTVNESHGIYAGDWIDKYDLLTQIKTMPTVKVDAQWAAKNINRWIPCSEMMPERNKMVLITYGRLKKHPEKKLVSILTDLSEENRKKLGVIAWMPMPEPYKEGKCGTN